MILVKKKKKRKRRNDISRERNFARKICSWNLKRERKRKIKIKILACDIFSGEIRRRNEEEEEEERKRERGFLSSENN